MSYETKTLTLPDNSQIKVYMADNEKKQTLGLSGVKKLADNEGMLFIYPQMMYLSFWMPDTYLNLDIFFLDQEMRVFYIERNVPAHPGRSENPPIYRTARIYAAKVLELKSSSSFAKKIRKGQKLNFTSTTDASR